MTKTSQEMIKTWCVTLRVIVLKILIDYSTIWNYGGYCDKSVKEMTDDLILETRQLVLAENNFDWVYVPVFFLFFFVAKM